MGPTKLWVFKAICMSQINLISIISKYKVKKHKTVSDTTNALV